MTGSISRVHILGVRVDDVTYDESEHAIADMILHRGYHHVVTPNAEIVMRAQSDPEFLEIMNQAALSIPDGVGLVLAGRLLGTPLRQQVTGTDMTFRLCHRAAREGWRVFLLGAAQGIAELAAHRLKARYPGLHIVGTHAGSPAEREDADVLNRVRSAGPVDLLFVAYGAPAQERWIARNQSKLGIPVAIGVGGVLDFASGRVRRAPAWIRRLGLDWLFRLLTQPWRWRRQLVLPLFAWAVLRVAIRRRLRRAGPFLGVDSPNLGQHDNN